jgi:hypothetical protein
MSGPAAADGSNQHHLRSTRSFTSMGISDAQPSVSDKSTPDQTQPSDQGLSILTPDDEKQEVGPDVFERRGSADSGNGGDTNGDEGFVLSRSVQDPSEELPIELISLTDR